MMKQIENFLSHTEEYFEEQEVYLFDKDKNNLSINQDYLKIPANIADLSSYDLVGYLNAFTQQKIYLRTIQSRLEIQKELAQRRYSEVFDAKYKELTNSSKNIPKLRKKNLLIWKKMRYLYYEYRDWQLKLDYIGNCIKSLEEGIFLFSREITRRGDDYSYDNRQFNKNNIKQYNKTYQKIYVSHY